MNDGRGGNGGDGSFERRLRAARDRQGLDPVANAQADPAPGNALAAGLRLGIEQVAAIAVGLALGWAIDGAAGSRPAFMVVGLVLGAVAGFVNVWRTLKPGARKKI